MTEHTCDDNVPPSYCDACLISASEAPVEEESEMTEREVMACPFCCAGVYAGDSYDALQADARALWAYRVVHECYRLGRRAPLASPENLIVEEAKRLVCELPAETRARLGECP